MYIYIYNATLVPDAGKTIPQSSVPGWSSILVDHGNHFMGKFIVAMNRSRVLVAVVDAVVVVFGGVWLGVTVVGRSFPFFVSRPHTHPTPPHPTTTTTYSVSRLSGRRQIIGFKAQSAKMVRLGRISGRKNEDEQKTKEDNGDAVG